VVWEKEPAGLFAAEIRIDVANRMGVLAQVAARVAATETNIWHVTVNERDADESVITFALQIKDRVHLARVLRAIRQNRDVIRIERTT
jgi:GTP pyrophosphokinase